MIPFTGRVLCAAFVAASLGHGASAQETSNQVAVASDWSVFEFPPVCGTEKAGEECRQQGTKPTECWGITQPRETVNTRDGQPVSVRRGDIRLFVTFRPGAPGEISFTGGYPFAEQSTVAVDVDGSAYEMFTDGEWAWPASPEADATLLAAMKAGTQATLTARSGKGTQTKDTFSLRGFTAAMTEAEARCK